MWIKLFFHFICEYYKTSYVLYIALYFILIECSEVNLQLKKYMLYTYMEEKFRKLHLKLKFHLQRNQSVFLRNSVLCNYVIISFNVCCMHISVGQGDSPFM